jgi:mono/diheme cytochrome c family protein
MKIVGFLLLLASTATFAQFHTSEVLASVPAKDRARNNPVANDPDAAAAGRKLFEDNCVVCHGAAAAGSALAPSLLSADIQRATPGEIYWVITKGAVRFGMPASKLSPRQRWQVVTYLISLNTPGKG